MNEDYSNKNNSIKKEPYSNSDVNDKLDKILEQVKSNDTSLDSCINLFDEAISLTNDAIKQIDKEKLIEMDEISKDGLQDFKND